MKIASGLITVFTTCEILEIRKKQVLVRVRGEEGSGEVWVRVGDTFEITHDLEVISKR